MFCCNAARITTSREFFDAGRGSRQVSVIHVLRSANAVFQRPKSKKDFKATSLKSYQHPQKTGAPNRNRTGTLRKERQILSLQCLPISPSGPTSGAGACTSAEVLHQPCDQGNKKGKLLLPFSKLGAGKRVRTVDLYLGKVSLYQLSYSRISESAELYRTDLNYIQKNSPPFSSSTNFSLDRFQAA